MKKIIKIGILTLLVSLFCACGDSTDPNKVYINMPDLVGKTVDEATALITECGAKNVVTNIDEMGDYDRSRIIVDSQSVAANTSVPEDKEIEVQYKRLINLYIDMKSDDNLLFNTYDMEVYVDDVSIGTVANGDSITKLLDVLEGKHNIKACKVGDDGVNSSTSISVDGDATVSGIIEHGGSISFSDITTKEGVDGASIEMPNVIGISLTEASSILTSKGFINFQGEPYADIWDKDNWVIYEQTVLPGEYIDKNQQITLSCKKWDSYYDDMFAGKDASTIISIANDNDISVKFVDYLLNDITETITTLDADSQSEWKCEYAYRNFDNDKMVEAYVSKSDVEEKTESTPVASTESTSSADDSVWYSTNSLDTVKNGNSGIYSYVKKGKIYDNYIIVDFDEGYVYYFAQRDDNTWCDKVKIESGDLNSQLFVTWHDGEDTWQECLHFKYKERADHLVLEDSSHFEYDYSTTDLEQALEYRDSKTVTER